MGFIDWLIGSPKKKKKGKTKRKIEDDEWERKEHEWARRERMWKDKEEKIRKMVQFRPFNLLHDPKGLGQFDVVFCRNVLIYFDVETKGHVMDRIANIMADDGVLFLGSAESTVGLTESFWPVEAGRGVYKLTDGPASLAEAGT